MSRKNVLKPYKMFDAVTLSANRTSNSTNVLNLDNVHILVEWSAGSTPVGTLAVQARHKTLIDSGSWFDLDGMSAIAISGNTGSHQIILTEMPFSEIRLVYTRSSGSATMSATIEGKTVGA